jgi:hypothetical protein
MEWAGLQNGGEKMGGYEPFVKGIIIGVISAYVLDLDIPSPRFWVYIIGMTILFAMK